MNAILFPVLLPLGLLVPGWLVGRALGTSAGFAGAWIGSAACLMNVVLLVDVIGMPITFSTLVAAVIIVCGVLVLVVRLRPSGPSNPASTISPPVEGQNCRWLWAPAAIGLVAIIVKATLDPLSGYDTVFRWDFLARQILRQHTLSFYPPVSTDDFLHYGWCDGIAPLISSIYLWTYLSLGKATAWATIPIVIAQALLLFLLVYELAALMAGPSAGRAAVALLGTSAILLWGVAMGQETGMTAVALVGMFAFIEKHRRKPDARWLIWAGIAAGTGALAREYGLAFFAVGAFALAWHRIHARGWLQFATAFVVVAAPWYVRNWAKTGNPLFCHELGGLFPVNPIHADQLRSIRALSAVGVIASWSDLAGAILGLAGLPFLLGLAEGIRRWPARLPLLIGLVTVMGLWIWSIAQTAGGWIYSVRVLSPAVAIGAVLGGIWIASRVSKRGIYWLAALSMAVALDAGPRSLFLPLEPGVKWWREQPLAWREFSELAARWNAQPMWDRIADAAGERAVVATDVVSHAQAIEHGIRAFPIFSPALRFLFDPQADFRACTERLRDLQIRFILLPRDNPFNRHQFAQYPFWRALAEAKPLTLMKPYAIYDMWSPEFMTPPAAPAPSH